MIGVEAIGRHLLTAAATAIGRNTAQTHANGVPVPPLGTRNPRRSAVVQDGGVVNLWDEQVLAHSHELDIRCPHGYVVLKDGSAHGTLRERFS